MRQRQPLCSTSPHDRTQCLVPQAVRRRLQTFSIFLALNNPHMPSIKRHLALYAILHHKLPFSVRSCPQMMVNMCHHHLIAALFSAAQQQIQHCHRIGTTGYSRQNGISRRYGSLQKIYQQFFLHLPCFHASMSSKSCPKSKSVVLTVKAGVSNACITVRAISKPWVIISARPAVSAGNSNRLSIVIPLRISLS